jgi:hypothetical protein
MSMYMHTPLKYVEIHPKKFSLSKLQNLSSYAFL